MQDTITSPAFRILRFRPGIKGIRRGFNVRVMHWQGTLWLVAKDAGAALGWHPDTFRRWRSETLTGNAWGYASVPTSRGERMMTLVAAHALWNALQGATTRQARAFGRWLTTSKIILVQNIPALDISLT